MGDDQEGSAMLGLRSQPVTTDCLGYLESLGSGPVELENYLATAMVSDLVLMANLFSNLVSNQFSSQLILNQ